MGSAEHDPDEQSLAASLVTIASIARTGLAFSDSLYERERYEEILRVIDRLDRHVIVDPAARMDPAFFDRLGRGVPGYVTPKCAVGAVVLDDERRILLVRRADSGAWLYPTGWADVGYSAAEVVVKEVREETGIECRPTRLLALLDGMRLGFTRIPMYTSIFLCKAVGGTLVGHPLETSEIGWFEAAEVPETVARLFARPWLSWLPAGDPPPERTFFDSVRER
jgi:ADP-ribose pyrophosphatase YjhB (NUDIX family)